MNIKNIRRIKKNCKVYDIEVENDHSFIVNDCVLHNCINCAALSGVHFKSISEAPGILHNLCRCICIPANSVSEPIPEFEEFIESLSEEEQEHVLGASRFELMNQYGVKPERFLNSGRVVPWKELKTDPFIVKTRNKNLNISETKLTGYALNPNHPLGKEKARVFKSALGYTVDNWKDLEENIRGHLDQSNMKLVSSDKYGKRLQCDTEITGPNGNTAVVRTGWIETPDGQITLTTIFVR